MTHHEDWMAEPPERGLLSRLIAPEADARPMTTAFLVGALGVAAFVASLTMDWQTATIRADVDQARQQAGSTSATLSTGLGSVDSLSLVYVLGTLALLGLVGAVINRPDLALRLRMTAGGVAVGLFAVVLAIAIRLPETVFNTQLMNTIYGGVPAQVRDRITSSYEAGLFLGFAAVVLPMAAIWLASVPAARSAAAVGVEARRSRAARHAVEQPRTVDLPPPGVPVSGGVDGLSVFPSEPLDLSVAPYPAAMDGTGTGNGVRDEAWGRGRGSASGREPGSRAETGFRPRA
jgi:hypothetical protein